MSRHIVLGDFLNSDSAHTAYRIGKISLYKCFLKPNRLEYLRSLIRLDSRNPHLRSNLYDSAKNCTIIIINCSIKILVKHIGVNQLPDRLMGKIRIHCTGAIAQKRCKVMYLSRLSGFQNNCNRSSLLRAHKMLLQS